MPFTVDEIPEIAGLALFGVRPTNGIANVTIRVERSDGTTTSLPPKLVRAFPPHCSRTSDNPGVLSFEVHGELTELIAAVNRVATAAEKRAPVTEIELRVNHARETAERLEAMIDAKFGSLRRHLAWLLRRHREGRPELADGDVMDLREHDLPDVTATVGRWAENLLDGGLVETIEGSWRAQRYDAAVREAFVYLEARMRALGLVDPGLGLTGRQLVARLLPGNGPSDRWGDEGLLGHLTDREQSGARELLNGAVSLFRNATAHRATAYTREEAEDVVHLVNLCLRLLDKYGIPETESGSGS